MDPRGVVRTRLENSMHWHLLVDPNVPLDHSDLYKQRLARAGNTRALLEGFMNYRVLYVATFAYVVEGDNVADAIAVADRLWQCLVAFSVPTIEASAKPEWKFPYSWSFLFGRRADPALH